MIFNTLKKDLKEISDEIYSKYKGFFLGTIPKYTSKTLKFGSLYTPIKWLDKNTFGIGEKIVKRVLYDTGYISNKSKNNISE